MLSLFLATVNFQVPKIDFLQIVPVMLLGFLVTAALFLEIKDDDEEPKGPVSRPTILGLGAVGLLTLIGYYLSWDHTAFGLSFNEMLYNDGLSRASGLAIALCALLTMLAAPDELERLRSRRLGEFCALLFSASMGMTIVACAANTMVMFLGLELFSIALYLLCIFLPDRVPCRESGIKYFLLSSAASAVLLYGLALLYGATGTTWLVEMKVVQNSANIPLGLAGSVLVLCGLMFKLAAVPFHFWAPDVYEGAPTTVTGFMSVATKVAALAFLWRFVDVLAGVPLGITILIVFALSALSMLVGNFLALGQKNVKRMLAFSGVANGGYLLIAPVVGPEMQRPMLFFIAAYLFGNLGAFLALAQLESWRGRPLEREDLVGSFQHRPYAAACLALCLVSLAGLPPAAGFLGKFFLFGRALGAGQLWLPILGVVGSLVGAGYYLGTAIKIFVRSPENEVEEESALLEKGEVSSTGNLAIGLCIAGVLYLGLYPSFLLEWLSSGLF